MEPLGKRGRATVTLRRGLDADVMQMEKTSGYVKILTRNRNTLRALVGVLYLRTTRNGEMR
ncbi:hypothetical protein DPMN_083648 [Dreissena polymorpha]|uniref:Uncharacterized protein n=1 Tax=Dreissena polymorpha TaxID=45954 RepID=A0A9D3Y9A7_DREPO|nr:hypothetical protein DPMN_083648 [Dreissena polymorpha]